MSRPPEYENLLKIGVFKEAVADSASIRQFMQSAREMATGSKLGGLSSAPRFTLAYEGMFNVVMAVLEFHGVRPGDTAGHRATSINRVAADLGLSAPMQSVLLRLHDARNRVTYRNSIPPVAKADVDAMQSILGEMLQAASALIDGVGR